MRAVVARVVLSHMEMRSLADGTVVCKCRKHFGSDALYSVHLGEMIEDSLHSYIAQVRVRGQMSALTAAGSWYANPARRAHVYSGRDIAGWCQVRITSLSSLLSGQQPPTQTGNTSAETP